MITVLRIEGEGFDLSTGKDLPPGIVLTNGERERVIYLDPAELRKVVELYINRQKAAAVVTSDPVPAQAHDPLPQVEQKTTRLPVEMLEPVRAAHGSYSDPDTGTDSV